MALLVAFQEESVAGSRLRSPGESVRHLNEVYGLDLDERDQELGQEVDAGFVPSYIIGKRSLQKANVGHCDVSFQDSFGDDLDKDSGTMAFYAFSKISFCPVLSGSILMTEPSIANPRRRQLRSEWRRTRWRSSK